MLTFGEFIKELGKARKKAAKEIGLTYTKLSLHDEAEWLSYFNEQKQKVDELKTEIDTMVDDLYRLTQE